MRYLVKAKLKADKERPLLRAIEDGVLGACSIAGDEYLRDMAQARQLDNETICCTKRLEGEMEKWGLKFLPALRATVGENDKTR